ncbi:unnamed protein product [Pylaiella littoralis]
MGLFLGVCMGLLAAVARTQELQNCSVDTTPLIVGSLEDADTLADSLGCSNGDAFAVEWVGEVFVAATIRVTSGTSLNIAGAGPGAIADGRDITQLFVVDEGSSLHLSDMTLTNGYSSSGGAIFANQSSVSFSGNISFISNSAHSGGAIYATSSSAVSWDGDGTEFSNNSADDSGGAIYATGSSTVSWDGDGTEFSNNSARYSGGAIYATNSSNVSWDGDGIEFSKNYAYVDGGAIYSFGSNVSWDGDGTEFSNNFANDSGGAIYSFGSNVSWVGDSTEFSNNSAYVDGGAIYAHSSSTVSWVGDGTEFSNNSADDSGGAVYAYGSTVSWVGDGTVFSNNSADVLFGGAIYAHSSSTVSWDGDGTEFISNSAYVDGGAIHAYGSSTVSWDGDGTVFSNNSVDDSGGAIYSFGSTVSWDGDGTEFISNSADVDGGGIHAYDSSTVSWDGDGTVFSNNSAYVSGGAIYSSSSSTVSWDGDSTEFSNNSADVAGGAICADSANVSWDGDGTEFSNNSAYVSGGAIFAILSTVSWDGDGTKFSNNFVGIDGGAIHASSSTVSWVGDGTEFVSNSADIIGGAIYAYISSDVSWGGNTTFSTNVAGVNGGALALIALDAKQKPVIGAAFIDNIAGGGGAIYLSKCEEGLNFTDVTFQSNNASDGGAVAAYVTGTVDNPATFSTCIFTRNTAIGSGGAIYSSAGYQEVHSCDFEGNSADVGGATALGGTSVVRDSSFVSNSVSTRGLAIAVVDGSLNMSGSWFDDNELLCPVGLYREDSEDDIEEGKSFARFEAVCYDCPGWNECSTCDITRSNVVPTCAAPLEHTSVDDDGVTLETLNINRGYWRATSESDKILACYNSDACNGGQTGADTYCSPGYEGPYCAVCGTDYSPSLSHTCTRCTISRRQGLMAAAIISALVAVFATVKTFQYMLSTELEQENMGCSTRVVRAVPRQSMKIIVVVWQILTQVFTLAENVHYARMHQNPCSLFAYRMKKLARNYEQTDEHISRRSKTCHRGLSQYFSAQTWTLSDSFVQFYGCVLFSLIFEQFADAANVTYPGVYQDLLSVIDVVNFDFGSALAAGCLWSDIDFHDRLLISTMAPWVIFGLLAMTYRIALRRDGAVVGHTAVANKIRHRHQTAVLLVTFLVYSSVSSMVFQTFACETLDDKVKYLRADYRIHCTDTKHKAFQVYAGIMIIVYPVGIPLLYAVLLFQRRDVLATAGADKREAQPIAGLWEAYRPERFYYEVVECGRRVMLTGVVVFIFPHDAAQIAITMLIAFFFSMVFEVLTPYKSASDMWLSRGGHVIVFLSMFDMLLLKVDVSGESDQSQAIFAGVLVAGHVLMIVAIFVEVVGICYASGNEGLLEVSSESVPGFRPRVGSDDVPVFESVPSSWRSFLWQQSSVSEEPGPNRSVSGTVVTGRP